MNAKKIALLAMLEACDANLKFFALLKLLATSMNDGEGDQAKLDQVSQRISLATALKQELEDDLRGVCPAAMN